MLRWTDRNEVAVAALGRHPIRLLLILQIRPLLGSGCDAMIACANFETGDYDQTTESPDKLLP